MHVRVERQAKDFASALQLALPGALPQPEAAGLGEREKGKEKGKEEA